MADESDVANAIVSTIVAALYPAGTAQPSILGGAAKVYRGFPQAANLDRDLQTKILNVSVYPREGMSRNTTRWLINEYDAPATPPSITAAVAGPR